MANNLTMTSPAYGAGKFGTALTSGSGLSTAYPPASGYTLEIWFKTTSTAATQVMFSIDGSFIALDASGKLITGFSGVTVTSTASYNDGLFHHFEIDGNSSSTTCFIDGVIVGSGTTGAAYANGQNLTIGRHQTFGFNWVGTLDEFASWSIVRHTAAFTPPSSAYASGLANMVQLYHFDGDGNDSATAAPVGNNALTSGTGNVLFSPGNWNIAASTAKTINAGAYFRTVFGGTSCSLQFDTSGLSAGFPKLEYRVDGTGPWTTVDLAATVAIAMPSETSGYASHLLEVNVRATTRTSRWALGGIVALTGIILDSTKVLSKPGQRPLIGYVFGDSITEGLKSLSSSEDTVNSSNGMQSYASILGPALGAEIGVIGFSGQGFSNQGDGSVPVFGSTYNLIYAGVTRTFLPAPDFIVINQGTNDGSNNTIAAATGVLNGLLAATPSTTKVFVLRPFNGNQASNLQAAIAACTTPARVYYIDTTGFFTSANSGDGLHPYGWENITHIGPAVAGAIRPILVSGTAPTMTGRNVSVTLGIDSSTPAANLSGLKVSFFDEASPDLHTVARFKTAAGTTNSSGVLSFTAQSTLAAGATGYLVVQGAAGVHYNAAVVVS